MKCIEIIRILEEAYPPSLAEEWDNPGLLIGDEEKEVTAVFTALDLTDETLAMAVEAKADMIVTHHPLIFRPVSKIVEQDFIGRRIRKLIREDISYYAMHTNFDKAGMADLNARQLCLIDPCLLEPAGAGESGEVSGYGRIGTLPVAQPLKSFAETVKDAFRLPAVRVYGDPERLVKTAAVSSGAGKSALSDAIGKGADVLVTGDLDYHTAIDAMMQGIAVIDAGHYGTEFGFIKEAADFLRGKLPGLRVIEAAVIQPYSIL